MNEKTKRIIIAVALVCAALVSMFGIARVASSPKTYSGTIEILEEKRNTAMGLTATATATATAVSALPDDTATPIANQIMQLSTWLLVVTCVIVLEKFLLTLLPYTVCTYVIPIACALLISYQFIKRTVIRDYAIKLFVFGLVISIVIPAGVQLGQVVQETYEIATVMTEENNNEKVGEQQEAKETKGFFARIKDYLDGAINTVKGAAEQAVEEAQTAFWNIVEGIAVMIVTTCVIPIFIAVVLLRVTGKMFAVDLNGLEKLLLPKTKKKEEKGIAALTEE